MKIIPKYKTKRLILKQVDQSDSPSYTKYFVDYEVIRFLSNAVPWPYPKNGVEDYIRDTIIPNQSKGRWTWGIFLKEKPNELIGCVELWKPGHPENRGFWLGKKFWNKGIMTEAVYPIMDFAFEKLGLEKLIFANAVGNIASRRIKEKTGSKLVRVKPFQFVDPKLTEEEVWELAKEDWETHKIANPMEYSIEE